MHLHLRAKVNKKGMSLVEVLISISFLAIVSMALMQTSLIGFQENTKNTLRDEAIRIAEETSNSLRSKPWTASFTSSDLSAGTVPLPDVERSFRSYKVYYKVTKTITDITSTNKQITVVTTWTYKGTTYSHSMTTIMGRT